ncbi:MAG TPA: hypothetical protein VNX01_12260 [Bacteroidia bacterium]|jgi:hypothetical protein|nr:hypothetical protein [Bacteroidia bacterium]
MKNNFLFYILLFGLTVKAQTISVRQTAPPEETTYLYDSLTQQATSKDYKKLIGQVIYGPKKLSVCNPLYEYKEYMLPEMEGKYFTVIDATDVIYGSREQVINLKLKELKTGKIISCSLSSGENYSVKTLTPLICIGYIEKQKKLHVGKKFIALQKVDFLYDVHTGDFFNYNIGSRWVCSDIKIFTMKDRCYEKPYFIFKDSIGNEVALNMKFGSSYIAPTSHNEDCANDIFVDEEKYTAKLMAKQQEEIQKQLEKALAEQQAIEAEQTRVNNLIKKYGKNFGAKVANGDVAMGMTKNMCRDAWGEPIRIQETKVTNGTTEKWFYSSNRFLFFTGNMVSSLQH